MRDLLLILGSLLGLFLILLAAGALIPARRRFSAWRWRGFRYRAWQAARTIGRVRAWSVAAWHPVALALGAAALVAIAVGFLPGIGDKLKPGRPILLGFLASMTLLWVTVHLARRKIVVPAFSVQGVKEEGLGECLAARLRYELASITSVYRTIDEALPSSHGRVFSLEVTVDDIGKELEDTVGTIELLSWDKFKIAKLLARVTGVFRGPHLSGSLHREGSSWVLTADLSGGGKRGNWQVSERDLPADERGACECSGDPAASAGNAGPPPASAYPIVRQMAYRIAASVASLGSPRWEAILSFTEGLRAYRKVRLTEAGRDVALREAECCFRKALKADNTFAQAHYNLGVVYTKLRERDAALAAFRRAIQADPSSFAAHAALATAYFDRARDLFYRGASEAAVTEDFLQARVFAHRAVDLAPSEPRARNVYAAARICEAWRGPRPNLERRPASWRREADEALDALHTASALSWRRMCRHALTGAPRSTDEARIVNLICLENLGEIYLETGEVKRSIDALREARRIEPRKPSVRLALGRSLAVTAPGLPRRALAARLAEARDEFYEVHGDGLPPHQRAARWVWLFAIHSELSQIAGEGDYHPASGRRRDERAGVERALGCALDSAAAPESLVLADPKRVEQSGPTMSQYRKQLGLLLDFELPRVEAFRQALRDRMRPRRALSAQPTAEEEDPWENLHKNLQLLGATAGASPEPAPRPEADEDDGNPWTNWRNAQRAVHQARRVLHSRPARAAELLRKAMADLRERHSRQIRDQGLEALLARALLLQAGAPLAARETPGDGAALLRRAACLREALDYAFRSVAANPASAARRLVLAQVHDTLGDHHQAKQERSAALSLGPSLEVLGDPLTLDQMAMTWTRRLEAPENREALIREAIELFESLRDLLEASAVPAPEPTGVEPRPLWFREHAAIHRHLGKFYLEAGNTEKAIENLRIALNSNYEALECQRLLDSIELERRRRISPSPGEAAAPSDLPHPVEIAAGVSSGGEPQAPAN